MDLPQKFAQNFAKGYFISLFLQRILNMIWNAADIGIDPELAYYQNGGSYAHRKRKNGTPSHGLLP